MRNPTIDYAAYARMAETVESTPTIEAVELVSASMLKDEILDLYANGYRKGFSCGWRAMDPYYTVRAGELTVVTGVPGHGKTAFVDNLMVNLARHQKWAWAVFSAENYPISRHIAGLCEIYSGKPFGKGPSERLSLAELNLCIEWVSQYFRFLQPRENSYSLNHIVQLAAEVQNLNALVIDPWNELDHARPQFRREDEYISIALTKLRWLARTSGIHIFVVAHPGKYIKAKDSDKKPVITLNDVKGASEWYAKADNGISVWRDEGDDKSPTEVHVQKIRFREVGRIGMVRLFYDRVSGRFVDPTHRPTIDELVNLC